MSKTLTFDFTDGVNNFLSANRIGDKEIAIGKNVWSDKGAIRARGAMVEVGQATVTIGSTTLNLTGLYQGGSVINLNGTVYIFNTSDAFGGAGSFNNGAQMPVYTSTPGSTGWNAIPVTTAGTATTNGTTAVTGSGTTWTTSVAVGDVFVINAEAGHLSGYPFTTISAIISDTSLTLSGNYPTSDSGAAYTILPNFVASGTEYSPSFETLLNKIYMTTPGRAMSSWDGTTFANVPGAPKVHFLKNFKNYMFAANTTANPARLFWSTVLNSDSWPASNFVDVAPNDGQQITGLFNDGTSLLIIKQRSIYKLSGDIFDPSNPTYTLTKLYTPPECVFDSANSWAMFQGVYLLYAGQGLYTYDGSNFIQRLAISDKLQTTFTNGIFSPTNFAAIEIPSKGQQAFTFNGNYWMTSSEGSTGSSTAPSVVVLDRNQKFWTFIPGTALLYGFFQMKDPTLSIYNSLWAFYHEPGTGAFGVIQLDQVFSSEAINASFTTKNYEFGRSQRFGKAYLLYKGASTGTITFGYAIDGGSTTNATVTMVSGAAVKSPPILIGQKGNSIQFTISHNSSSEDFEVYGIELETNDLKQ